MSSVKLEYASINEHHVIRMSGEVRYDSVASLQEFIEKIKDDIKPFIIDLNQADLLDSTALGVLALIAKLSRMNQQKNAQIFVKNDMVIEALEGVCFDQIFDIHKNVELQLGSNGQFLPLKSGQLEFEALSETVKKAHETLAEISEDNAKQFKDVNSLLSK